MRERSLHQFSNNTMASSTQAEASSEDHRPNNPNSSHDHHNLYQSLKQFPKVELHAHLNGCIRDSTLFELAQERNVILSPHHFASHPNNGNNKNINNNNDDDNGRDLTSTKSPTSEKDSPTTTDRTTTSTTTTTILPPPPPTGGNNNMYNVLPRSLQDCFDMFAELPLVINDLPALRRITWEALEDFSSHHTVYLELRSTPKRLLRDHREMEHVMTTKRDYIETILNVMKEFTKQQQERLTILKEKDKNDNVVKKHFPLTCRFIVAVDRSLSFEEAKETIDLTLEMVQQQSENNNNNNSNNTIPSWIIGFDLGGNPTKQEFALFRPLFEKVRTANAEVTTTQQQRLGITLHCAEIPCDKETHPIAWKEAKMMLDFCPDRLGHALLLPPDLQQQLQKTQIPVETCPTSNVMTLELAKLANGNLIEGLRQHPSLYQWLVGDKNQQPPHPLTIGTDDPGVFDTTTTKELFLLLQAFELSMEQISNLVLRSMEYAFCSKDIQTDIQKCIQQYISG